MKTTKKLQFWFGSVFGFGFKTNPALVVLPQLVQ